MLALTLGNKPLRRAKSKVVVTCPACHCGNRRISLPVLCRIEMPEQASSAEYKKINHAAETPSVMNAEGLMISESMAILGHLSQYGTEAKLSFRQGSQGFDRLNQMLAFEHHLL